jgi:Fic family protein
MGESIIEYISPSGKDATFFMEELIEVYQKNKPTLPPLILASLISSFFVFIHPFMDGNGRTSRYIFHYILKEL